MNVTEDYYLLLLDSEFNSGEILSIESFVTDASKKYQMWTK